MEVDREEGMRKGSLRRRRRRRVSSVGRRGIGRIIVRVRGERREGGSLERRRRSLRGMGEAIIRRARCAGMREDTREEVIVQL
jgi:hypothetical protein